MNCKTIKVLAILLCLNLFNINQIYAEEINTQTTKHPDYAYLYLGHDKYEGFNRKIFDLNLKMNKTVLRPIHIVWCSIMPKYGMDRINNATKNIEYPIRLVSSLIQRDFCAVKCETIRFFTNTTIGLGGMFDPAKKLFKLQCCAENMEQALAKCKIKSGSYLVMPVINSTTPRDIIGRILDAGLNPTSYIASPAFVAIKAAISVNRTYFMQPIIKMIESTYADPYDIAKKLYGLERHIKHSNLDRMNIISEWNQTKEKQLVHHSDNKEEINENINEINDEQEEIISKNILKGNADKTEIILKEPTDKKHVLDNIKLIPDIILENYNPQCPITDSMRTALFEADGVMNSIWAEFSIWNRCFYNRLKTASLEITPNREKYKYKYLLQKTKSSPLAIIYPSIGEGIMSTHSASLAKIFYDEGYSVIILGSHFQWEFVKSMPDGYKPGIPTNDVHYVKLTTDKIINTLAQKYNHKFNNKTIIGTSFGAMMSLFMGEKEFIAEEESTDKYIAICPPMELIYAMTEIDKTTSEWEHNPEELKNKVALTAAKIIQLVQNQDNIDKNLKSLPFSEEEAKLITSFILHQKLSDLIFALENQNTISKSNIYEKIHKTDYRDYAKQYLINSQYKNFDDINKDASLHKISQYLMNANNYKIYHSVDDYLTSTKQLHQLKTYTGTKTILFSNGGHLGFLYRPEFIKTLKEDIHINKT